MFTAMKTLAVLAIGVAFALPAGAATTKADYNQAKSRADADYKVEVKKCDALKGNDKDVCVKDAKAARDKAKAEAEADYKGTAKARAEAREDKAEADYKAAKERCDALSGNDKDVCIKRAKAEKTKAEADAKAQGKGAEAHADAAKEKRKAEYKVAREKCDALSGDAKDRCVDDAKQRYMQ